MVSNELKDVSNKFQKMVEVELLKIQEHVT
jgi:hypothetical protein